MLYDTITAASRSSGASAAESRSAAQDRSAPLTVGLSERIQAVRGLAVLLLVVFHAVATSVDTALNPADATGLVFFTKLFGYVRMPVFAFIAGFVYAPKPVTRATRWDFARRKVMRLYIPFAIAVTLMYLMQRLSQHAPVGYAPHELWRIYLYPAYQFWFIQALLLIFALMMLLEPTGALATLRRFAVVFVAAVAVFLWLPDPETLFFSLPQAEYLLPFFLLGVGAHRFRGVLLTNTAVLATLLLLLASITIQAASLSSDPAYKPDRGSLLSLVAGLSAGFCAISLLPRLGALRRVGDYSFTIFLYHFTFIWVFAHVCKVAGFRSAVLLALVLTAVGVLGPMALQRLLQRNAFARTAVLGMR